MFLYRKDGVDYTAEQFRKMHPNVGYSGEIPPDVFLIRLGYEKVQAVPKMVTRRQAKQALAISGFLDQVQPAIDAIADPLQRNLMQIEWDDSQEFLRDRPQLIALATALGLGDAQIDELFILAATL